MRPRALDLFCGGGGAATGLYRAGFDVVGVDLNPQPHYPFEFRQADALTFPIEGFDFVWASPPCQHYSTATRDRDAHPDLVAPVRDRLRASGLPYVIENVMGAPLVSPVMLCGSMFGLGVVRHRLFETSWLVLQPEHPRHAGSIVTGEYVTVAGNAGVPAWTMRERERRGMPRHIPGEMDLVTWQRAMGIDWLPRKPLTQAIPPAYSEFLARQFLAADRMAA
jgi:DNA (cytosine-5)-methyltransferase 1